MAALKLTVINKQTGNAISWSLVLPDYHVIARQGLLKQQCVSYQLVNGVPTVSHTHIHTAPVSARVLGWVPLPKATGTLTLYVFVCVCVCVCVCYERVHV